MLYARFNGLATADDLPSVVDVDTPPSDRNAIYLHGGVVIATTRILLQVRVAGCLQPVGGGGGSWDSFSPPPVSFL